MDHNQVDATIVIEVSRSDAPADDRSPEVRRITCAATPQRPRSRPQKRRLSAIRLLAHGRSSTCPFATNRSSRPSASASVQPRQNPSWAGSVLQTRTQRGVNKQPSAAVPKQRARFVDQVRDEQVNPPIAIEVVGNHSHALRLPGPSH